MRRLLVIMVVLSSCLCSYAQRGIVPRGNITPFTAEDNYARAWDKYIAALHKSFSQSMAKPADIPEVISIMVSDTTFMLKNVKTLEYYVGRVRQHPVNGGYRMLMLQNGNGISRQWLDSTYVYHIGKWKRGFLHGSVLTVLSSGDVRRVEFSWGHPARDSVSPVSEAEAEEARRRAVRMDAAIRAMQGHFQR